MMLNRNFWILFFLALFVACRQDHFSDSPSDQPEFSVDTLSFDTVFTTIGSATLSFKIYNRHKDFLKISSFGLGAAEKSHFKLNVDGIPGIQFRDIELRPQDSLYVFCEVKINPSDPLAVSPFIILDSIVCQCNAKTQIIYLDARGQNANYFPGKANKSEVAFIDLQHQTLVWNDPKPYVVYGVVYIDHGKLQIAEGTRIHFYGGITKAKDKDGNTYFYNDGRLIIGADAEIHVLGSLNNPVHIQGVRLEESYAETPGQWSGIVLDKFSKNNEFNFVSIKNNLIGLFADSMSSCILSNSVFANNSYYGIAAYAADLDIGNCLFYNQGQSSLSLECGGNYKLSYCTLANFGNDESACFVSNNFCVDPPLCNLITSYKLKAEFTNCVFSGNNIDEFYIRKDPDSNVPFELQIDHCLLKIKDLLKPGVYPDFLKDYTSNCMVKNTLDSLFKDISKNNFQPDTLSILENKARPLSAFTMDLIGTIRDPQHPDIGCYEYRY